MTQLRKFRDSISNYFDEIERGVGKRGSTFTDVDAISHDMDTHRFLFREFKYEREPLDKAQLWVMRDLSALPRCTVWLLRRLDDGLIGWWDVSSERGAETLTIEEYRDRLHRWWYGESAISSTVIRQACLHRPEFIDNGVCWICSHAGVGAPFDR